jgi:DNA-binding LytR/AlgR family response regulator
MEKIKCIAIDDEPFALEMLAEDIGRVSFLELRGEFSSPILIKDNLDDIDLIFLDIQMPSISGIHFLRNLKNPPMVIVTTAFHQYAIDGFDLKVIDYLLKPIPYERFLQAVDHAKELFELRFQRQAKEKHFLMVYSEYKQIKIFSEEIVYIEGLKDYVKIYLLNQPKPILTRLNLKGILEKLPQNQFCRVHNSFIVAMAQIQSFQKNFIFLQNGQEIPVGAKFLEGFFEKINQK